MPPFIQQAAMVPGTVGDELSPTAEQLYLSVDDLATLYGMTASEPQLRLAQSLVNTTCNRTSLWPVIYTEQLSLPSDRQEVILNVRPVIQILQLDGRYGYGRRDRRVLNNVNYDYLAAIAVWGSPPGWTSIDPANADVYGATGEVWLPTGHFLVSYSEVRVKYLAGYTQIPDRVKAAMADILNTICARGVSDRRMLGVGKVQQVFSSEGFVSSTARDFLAPFIVQGLF